MKKILTLIDPQYKALGEIRSSISDSKRLISILNTIKIVGAALFFIYVVIILVSENILIVSNRYLILISSAIFFGMFELSIFIVKVIAKQLNSIVLINALVENNENQ